MVPDKFNMVDMGGIDLIMMQGEEVSGLYDRLVESITQCRYQCLYNWLFDGVIIPPTYVELEVNENDEVVINEGVTVTSDDVIHIYSIEPPAPEPEIIPLLAEENGVYSVPTGKDGFNPVTVDVPSYTPVIQSKTITENGIYTAPSGVDGFSPVEVNVSDTYDFEGLFVNANLSKEKFIIANTSGSCVVPYKNFSYVPIAFNQPFKIHVEFKLLGGSTNQALFGSRDTSYFVIPSAELKGLNNLWAGLSANGNTWTTDISINEIPLVVGTVYRLDYEYTGEELVLTFSDGVDAVSKRASVDYTPYYSQAREFAFCCVNNNNRAYQCEFHLNDMYLEQNSVIIWGVKK